MQSPTKQFQGEIRPLTGLRGIAAVLVVCYHFVHAQGTTPSEHLFNVPNGYLAVDLFFILSGFVLSYNYARSFADGVSAPNYFSFIFKRIARIYPPYFCIMLLYVGRMTIKFSNDDLFARYGIGDYIANVFLVNGWGLGVYPLIGPSWSVSAEMFCYFLFPFIVFLLVRRPILLGPMIAAAVGTLFVLAIRGEGVNGPLDLVAADTLEALVRAACGFSIGIACYWIYTRIPAVSQKTLISVEIAAYTAIVGAWIAIDSEIVRYAGLIAIVMVSSFGGKVSEAAFSNRVVYFLGQISYSVYLLHALFLSTAVRGLIKLSQHLPYDAAYGTILALYLGVVISTSYVSYIVFEMKGRQVMLALPRLWARSARA